MENRPLIFNCILNEVEIFKLQEIKNKLADSLFELHRTAIGCDRLLHAKIELTILDLREVLNSKNLKGYAWTSYILSLLLLKIYYIMSILEPMESLQATELFEVFLEIYVSLDKFLDHKYFLSIGDTEPETLG